MVRIVSVFVMVKGMTSAFKINHIFVKILNIIDKYIPLAVTLKNGTSLLHFYTIYTSKQLNTNCFIRGT